MKLQIARYSLLYSIPFLLLFASGVHAQTFTVQNGGTVTVQNGTLDLGTATTLDENGGQVTGPGQIKATRTLSAPSGEDVAGLGAVITGSANFGETVVIRSHAVQTLGERKSIERYYDITPANNSGLDAALAFNYVDSELNNLPEDDLTLFRSDDGGSTYATAGYDSRNASANTITLGGINSFTRFSAAAPDFFNYGSLALNGIDNYMNLSAVADDMSGASQFTIAFWVKPDFANQTDESGVAPFGINDAAGDDLLYILIGAPGSQDHIVRIFDASGLPIIEGPTLTDDTWHHIAFTYDNGTGTMYIDGRNVGQDNLTLTLSSDDQWSIGQEFDGGSASDFLDGRVDEVRIRNTALTGQQIRNDVFQPLKGNEAGVIGYYSLNNTAQGSGTVANDATLVNNPSFNSDTYPEGTFISGNTGWRMMGSPSTGTSYGTLLADLFTQGFPGATFETGTSNVYTWNEGNGAQDTTARGFVSIGNAADVPAGGQGFIFFAFADEDPNQGGVQDDFPKMVRVDQVQSSGNVTFPVTITKQGGSYTPSRDGFNLVSNPYGATIDWDASGWTKTNMDNIIYIWDHSANGGNGAYLSWNGTTGTLGDGLIAPWQGFWVKANNTGAPALEASDAVRDAGGVFYEAPGETRESMPQIKFTLSQYRVGELSDQSKTVVMFNDGATLGKDRLDAWKLESLNTDYLSLYTTGSGGEAFDINALPSFAKASEDGLTPAESSHSAIEVEMDFDGSNVSGEYTLAWTPQALPDGWTAVLTDTHTDTEMELSQSGDYTFTVSGARNQSRTKAPLGRDGTDQPARPHIQHPDGLSAPKGGTLPTVMKDKVKNHRFTLRFAPKEETGQQLPTELSISAAYPNPFGRTCYVDVDLPEETHVRADIYDVLGRKVATVADAEMPAGYHTLDMDAGAMNIASGVYLCRLQVGETTETMKMTFIK